MEELISLTAIEDRYGFGRGRARNLVDVGLLQPVATDGQRRFFDMATVEALMSRPKPTRPHGPALVVRISPKSWNLAIPEVERRDNVRKWWPVARPELLVGEHLLVTVHGFVLDVVEVTGYESAYGRRSFEVKDAGKRGDPFKLARLTPSRGPIAFVLPAA